MVLLENDVFLKELSRLFLVARYNSCISLCMKRYDGRNKHTPKVPKPGQTPYKPTEYLTLIRARVGANKISTVVKKEQVASFHQAYWKLLKLNMDGLKKLKSNKSKSKTTL